MFVLSCASVSATEDKYSEIKRVLKVEDIDNAPEKDKVLSKFNLSQNNLSRLEKSLNWDKKPAKTGTFYKIYNIRDNIRKYYEDKNFQKFISENNSLWETPVFSENGELISTTRVSNVNGEWFSSSGHGFPLEFIDFYIDYENIYNVLKENDILKPEIVKHVRMREIPSDIIYVKSEKSEYGIPLVLEAKELGIENYRLYKMEELIDKLSVKYVDPYKKVDQSGKSGGSRNYSTMFSKEYLIFIVVGFIACLTLAFIISKRKLSRGKI